MDNLVTYYKQKFNLQNATFTRIEHEDAIIAIVFKVTQPDNTEFILKICARPSHYTCEVFFLNYFAGKLPVLNEIEVLHPEAGRQGAILMEEDFLSTGIWRMVC